MRILQDRLKDKTHRIDVRLLSLLVLLDDPQNVLLLMDRLIFPVTRRRSHAGTLTTVERAQSERFASTNPTTTRFEHVTVVATTYDARCTHDSHVTRSRTRVSRRKIKLGSDDDARRHTSDDDHTVARAKTNWELPSRDTRFPSRITRPTRSMHESHRSLLCVSLSLSLSPSFYCCCRWHARKQSDEPNIRLTRILSCTIPGVYLGRRLRSCSRTKPYEHNRTTDPECHEYVQRFLRSSTHAALPLPDLMFAPPR